MSGPIKETVKVTSELNFEGYGIGKLIVPLVIRRQACKERSIDRRNLR